MNKNRAEKELRITARALVRAEREVARLMATRDRRVGRAVALGLSRGEAAAAIVAEGGKITRQRVQQLTEGIERGKGLGQLAEAGVEQLEIPDAIGDAELAAGGAR